MSLLTAILAHILGVQQVRRRFTDLELGTVELEQRADEIDAQDNSCRN